MKKLFFLFAMVLTTCVVFAQTTANIAETEQDGNQNDVLIKQVGDLNEAGSHQYGNENDASVVQTGDENYAIADQLNGNNNNASILQDGDGNEAYIAQGMVVGYIDDTHTTSMMTANRNTALIDQVGDDNFVGDVVQIGDDNTTDIDQVGDGNDAYSYQGWAYRFWGETYATSHLSSYNSIVDISQYGNDNSGRVWQYGGNRNEAYINQQGNDNTVSFVQGWIYTDLNYDFYNIPVYNTQGNYASANQLGNDNYAKNIQLGNSNIFKITQNGNDNSVGFDNGASGLEETRNAYFVQDGSHNKFVGVYKSATNDLSLWESQDAQQNNGSTVDVASYQRGNYNEIGLRQGQDDLLLIQQDGIGNEALLWQQGADQNTATMMQFGNNNTAAVVQIQQ